MAVSYMIGVIEQKCVDNKVESFNKKVTMSQMMNSSIDKYEHTLILYSYHIGTVLPVMSSFRKKSLNHYCFVFLSRYSFRN